jgi:LuxR family maltose regulon positive regulatory protein
MSRYQLHLNDYVLTEVIVSLTQDQRDFILRSSVLDRLSAPLCDSALGIDNSAEILDQLDETDPFLSRLGDDGVWFQYHSLVRDSLRREQSRHGTEEKARVLRRAASWFLENGDPEQAIRHLLDAGDTHRAKELLLRYEDQFLDHGQIGTFLSLADSLGAAEVEADPRLAVSMAWADGSGGSGERVVDLVSRAESAMTGAEDPPTGWATLAGSAASLRAIYGHDAIGEIGYRNARRAIELEQDDGRPGYSVARMALGLALAGRGRFEEAIPHLQEAWEHSDLPEMPVFARLPIAGLLAGALVSAGRLEGARHVIAASGPIAHKVERALGDAAGPAVSSLRVAKGALDLAEGNANRARQRLSRAVSLAEVAGNPSLLVRALAVLAESEVAAGDEQAARRAVEEARDIISSEPVFPASAAALDAVETRLGRSAVETARAERRLVEHLTDRELSILRALPGYLTQREIGRELYLSINTVKGYTKSLYRKLGVTSRTEAVERARDLGLI